MRMFLKSCCKRYWFRSQTSPVFAHAQTLFSSSWNTRKQVFERDDNGRSISYAIFPRKTRVAQMHRTISRQENITDTSPRRADSWFPSLPSPSKECMGWRRLTSQPKFPGWMVYQIFLAMGLRSRARGRQELWYNFPSPHVSTQTKRAHLWDYLGMQM